MKQETKAILHWSGIGTVALLGVVGGVLDAKSGAEASGNVIGGAIIVWLARLAYTMAKKRSLKPFFWAWLTVILTPLVSIPGVLIGARMKRKEMEHAD